LSSPGFATLHESRAGVLHSPGTIGGFKQFVLRQGCIWYMIVAFSEVRKRAARRQIALAPLAMASGEHFWVARMNCTGSSVTCAALIQEN
jgi:hypothetical protein